MRAQKIICIYFISLFSPFLTFAKESDRSFDIKVELYEIVAVQTIPVRVGIAVADKVSLGLLLQGTFYEYGYQNVLGIQLGIDGKFYLNNKVFKDSWYIKPFITAGHIKRKTVGNFKMHGGVTAGYGWVWHSGFSLDVGLGFLYIHEFKKAYHDKPWPLGNMIPVGELALGFAF